MKALVLGLSLIGLIMASSIQNQANAEEKNAEKNTDAEVVALVDAAAKAEAKPLGEDQTPLFKNKIDKKEKTEGGVWLWVRMIGSLALVVVLLIGGLYAFRQMPGGRNLAGKTKMIQVLAQHYIGTKKSLAVVRVAGETVLVGITDNHISLLKNLSLLEEEAAPSGKDQKFNKTLASKMNTEDEFSMKGLKDLIGDRLKSMKDLG